MYNPIINNSLRLCMLLSLMFTFHLSISKDIILINKDNKIPITEREAIIILPGFGTIFHNTNNQVLNFKNKGYDVFIPDYISRKSLNNCVENLNTFIIKHKLASYKHVHILGYIIGSWTINQWGQSYSLPNIKSIIYDRSPLQEKAPEILVKENSFIARILFGKVIRELSKTKYPSRINDSLNIGIIVECKATKLIWKKRKSLPKYAPVLWGNKDLNQDYDDIVYVYMNHDEMYTTLELVSMDIFHFFKNGLFLNQKDKGKIDRDYFEPFYKK
jgi:hypothetical protein